MNPKFESSLFSRYPEMFDSPSSKIQYTGIECDSGWCNIIESFCSAVSCYYLDGETFLPTTSSDTDTFYLPDVVVTQIKEKYGTLRIYYTFVDSRKNGDLSRFDPESLQRLLRDHRSFVEGVSRAAEEFSSYTCEVSGLPGRTYVKDGYIRTLCPEEASRLGYSLPTTDDIIE